MPPRLFNVPLIKSTIKSPRCPSCLFHVNRVLSAEGTIDYYKTLELDQNASPVDIKKSEILILPMSRNHPGIRQTWDSLLTG